MNQEDFCGAITVTYFAGNCLDLPLQYLRNEDIFKVLVILFPKINNKCDNRFIKFAQTGIHPYTNLYDLYKFSVIYKHKYAYLKSNKSGK